MWNRPRKRRCAALTLVELGASVAILGAVIASLLVARVRAQRTLAEARDMDACTELCGSVVAAVRAGVISEGEGTSSSVEGGRWLVRKTDPPDDAPDGLAAYEVTVRAERETGPEPEATVIVWLPE